MDRSEGLPTPLVLIKVLGAGQICEFHLEIHSRTFLKITFFVFILISMVKNKVQKKLFQNFMHMFSLLQIFSIHLNEHRLFFTTLLGLQVSKNA